jgi:hypothetical protein
LLTDFLGFVFDELAFSFSESDCGNPALMAHLRGLKCERIYGRSYADGLREYADFALGLMARKEFPERLLTAMANRYAEPGAEVRMRKVVEEYAMDAFALDDTQLVCMVYSPFVDRGAGLAGYLQREQPALLDHRTEIDRLLEAEAEQAIVPTHTTASAQTTALTQALETISGLSLRQLRVLYHSRARTAPPDGHRDLIGAILAGDPHKSVITTQHSPDGPAVTELLTGR